ncbi:MAG: DUF882 domain-containing protein [Candidatus Electrothrix aestuarii]|uniref:Murein endopeptidase K n=1 Tax=Candidatus Electrothrix aestuarii TaxID=3062594 RepID=A0AAU8LUT0_9BACT|nr:DUF882 domain-containing protein [Candidatus Electrothrix aestuarii]
MKRRSFLLLGAKTAAGILLTQTAPVWAGIARISGVTEEHTPRTLSFYHTHTREQLDITYAIGETYNQEALDALNLYLRDFRTAEVHPIDPALLDILWTIQQKMGCTSCYEVISGYRSPATNSQLHSKSKGVAKRSLHMQGMAIDVRLTGQQTNKLRDCAISLKAGGVGYYAASDFVHIDTGRVRTW